MSGESKPSRSATIRRVDSGDSGFRPIRWMPLCICCSSVRNQAMFSASEVADAISSTGSDCMRRRL
jgi:hypothetical protein